jgi:predicted DNA-binding transcriptional regulator AlpA
MPSRKRDYVDIRSANTTFNAASIPVIHSPEVLKQSFGLSRTTLWRMAQRKELVPIQLSPGRVGYLAEDIQAWIASKKSA